MARPKKVTGVTQVTHIDSTDRPSKENRAADRPDRIPVGAPRDILAVKGVPDGYVARWVNDVVKHGESRIKMFLAGGYGFVRDSVKVGETTVDSNSDDMTSVVSRPVGGGITAYLMAIPKEWYDADQVAKRNERQENRRSVLKQFEKDEGRYGSIETSRD